jgi:hypothetical protein
MFSWQPCFELARWRRKLISFSLLSNIMRLSMLLLLLLLLASRREREERERERERERESRKGDVGNVLFFSLSQHHVLLVESYSVSVHLALHNPPSHISSRWSIREETC